LFFRSRGGFPAEPERIIFFGSAARGETGTDSDIDLLVIKAGSFNR
jgi:predicted nucleotidyltransferase